MPKLTKEEAMKIRPPQEVINGINTAAAKSGIAKDAIKRAFYQALCSSSLDNVSDINARCKSALAVVNSQLKAKMRPEAPTFPMEFTVIAVGGITTVQVKGEKVDPISKKKIPTTEGKKLAKAYGVFRGISQNPADPQLPAKLGIVTMWGDACQTIQHLESGCSYTCDFAIKIAEGETHYELTLNNYKQPVPCECNLPAPLDVVKGIWNPIEIAEIPFHPSEKKLIHGRIVKGDTRIIKSGKNQGKNMGYIVLEDPAVSFDTPTSGEKRDQMIQFNAAPEFALMYPAGTECYVLASITQSEQYGMSAFGEFIIATMIPEDLSSFFDETDDLFGSEPETPTTQATPAAPASPNFDFDDGFGASAQNNEPAAVNPAIVKDW